MVMNIVIFLAGLLVYAGYGLPGFGYLAAAVLLSYGTGRLTKRCPWMMWVCVALNAAMLAMLRLQPLTGITLLAPLGISYFTLQIISYNVDVYRGKYEPERNLFRYSLFVTYLPHLFLGPIERYDGMRSALFENRRLTCNGFLRGSARVVWGLFKKYVIAARAGILISTISGDPAAYQGAYALAAMILYSVQLYCDFSGGIDMVLGVSKMAGITLSENFDAPFLAQSVQEFWRRWHITLGSWLREYIYIPMGGNRKGKLRKILNLMVTFLISGVWHGIQYLFWGLGHGIFVAFGNKLKTKWKTLNRMGTFLLVSLLWAFFVWPDMGMAVKMLASVFTTFNYSAFFAGIGSMGLTLGDGIVLGIGVAAVWCYDVFQSRLQTWFDRRGVAARVAVLCTLGLLVLVFGVYGIGFRAEAFIYSRF